MPRQNLRASISSATVGRRRARSWATALCGNSAGAPRVSLSFPRRPLGWGYCWYYGLPTNLMLVLAASSLVVFV